MNMYTREPMNGFSLFRLQQYILKEYGAVTKFRREQLIMEKINAVYDMNRIRNWTIEMVEDSYGLKPGRLVSWRANHRRRIKQLRKD